MVVLMIAICYLIYSLIHFMEYTLHTNKAKHSLSLSELTS